jgi:arylsulfatase A-like enzyme
MAIVRRNLVLMLAHGLRSDALSDARVWPLATHRIDQLATRGVRLVADAASPADGPAMASLLTGLHARQHGLLEQRAMPPLADALPGWLAAEGYRTVGVGCVGAIAEALDHAVVVDEVAHAEPVGCAYMADAAGKGLAEALAAQRRQRLRYGPFEPDRLLLEPDDDIDGFIAGRAAAEMERLPGDRPWALIVIFSGPGNDLPPPTMYDQLVRSDSLRGGFTPTDMRRLDQLAEPDYPRAVLQRLEPGAVAQLRADYLGRVALVDHGVGRIVQGVSRRMDRQRTWFMLGADRGVLLGEHGLVGHRSFLGPAIETPLIVAPPLPARPPRDRAPDGLFSTVDLAATAAHLLGADRPRETAGRSVLPLFTGDALDPQPPGGLISEFGERVMLETERHKITFDRRSSRVLSLFDLLDDPAEKQDLMAGDPERPREVVNSLRVRLASALLPLRAAGHVFDA